MSGEAAAGRYCSTCEQVVLEPCQSPDCTTPEFAAPASAAPAQSPSDALLDRIEHALQRHLDGHCPRRLPVDVGDSDLVLEDLRSLRRGEPLRFAQLEADTARTAYVEAYRVRGAHHVVVSAATVPLEAPPAVVARLVRTRSGFGDDYMLPDEAQNLWAELLQLASAGDAALEVATDLATVVEAAAAPELAEDPAGGWIEVDCPACGIDYDYPDEQGLPAWPRLCPCGHVYSQRELRANGQHYRANGEPSGLGPPTADQGMALQAARRLQAGENLDACPQGVILELLQLLQLEAAERRMAERDPLRTTRHIPTTPAKRARLERLRAAAVERDRREERRLSDSSQDIATSPGREATT